MNKERILQLADVVEKGHHKFNGIHAAFSMHGWYYSVAGKEVAEFEDFQEENIPYRPDVPRNECNTAACIAGWACLLFDYDNAIVPEKANGLPYIHSMEAVKLLDITRDQAERLFSTYTDPDITGAEAAKVLRHFAETGRVEWFQLVIKHHKRPPERHML